MYALGLGQNGGDVWTLLSFQQTTTSGERMNTNPVRVRSFPLPLKRKRRAVVCEKNVSDISTVTPLLVFDYLQRRQERFDPVALSSDRKNEEMG